MRSGSRVAPAALCLGAVVALLLSSASAAVTSQSTVAAAGGPRVIRGGPSSDVLHGGRGNDRIYAGRAGDFVSADAGSDRVHGGAGNDHIDGGAGNDRIAGGAGDDQIDGGRGTDRIAGGAGNDRLIDKEGATAVSPGSGTNDVDVADGHGNDRVTCVAGSVSHINADLADRIAPGCLGQGSTVDYSDEVTPETWMHDIAPNIQNRTLTDIVIPGSHDTGTYALTSDPITLIGKAQTADIWSQLEAGIREFDIRVGWTSDLDCYGPDLYHVRHGILTACGLTLSGILDPIAHWTYHGDTEQEIILINLTINTQGSGTFPTDACQEFVRSLGSALLTPNELQAAYGTTDPGQVTVGDLWSMPGHPRVIMDNNQCMDAGDPSAGQWADLNGAGPLGDAYYANQCYANPYTTKNVNMPGIATRVLAAAQRRSGYGGGEDNDPGNPVNLGPPKVGGLWKLFIQATPTAACFESLGDFDLPQQEQVLAALKQQWQTDPDIQAHLNIVSGDFVQASALYRDVVAMDETWPPAVDSVALLGPHELSGTIGQSDVGCCVAAASYRGTAARAAPVTFTVSPADGTNGPNWGGKDSVTVTANEFGQADTPLMSSGPHVGTWTVTASAPGASTEPSQTLVIKDSCGLDGVFRADPGNPATVQAGATLSGGFLVRSVQPIQGTGDVPIGGVPVTFDASGTGGTFNLPDGSHSATWSSTTSTVPSTFGDARSPAFTAGTSAGAVTIFVRSPTGVTCGTSLPLTVTPADRPPGPPAITTLGNGDGQVSVGFADSTPGTSPITSHQVSASDLSHPGSAAVTATGASSPIVVTGLVNGDTYVFAVTATSAAGTSDPSPPSGQLNVGVAPAIQRGPADGTVGRSYSSGFTVTGAPAPTVTQVSGDVPPGLTLNGDGTLTGAPTKAGTYSFTVQVVNPVGIANSTVSLTISPAAPKGPPPAARGRHA